MRNLKKKGLNRVSNTGTIFAWLLLIVYLSPLYLLFVIAFKTKEDFAKNGFQFPKEIIWSNVADAAKEMNVLENGWNSVLISFVSIALILLFAAMAAYVIGRRRAKVYSRVYNYLLAGMMIPFPLIMLPLYRMMNIFGILGTRLSVICIYVGTTIPLALVILTGFIKTIPKELDEAALIDGASPFRIFWEIILPLIRAPLVTVLIICLVSFWNDLLTPLLFLSSDHQTLIVGLYNFKSSRYTTDWTMTFAGAIITILPLLVVFLAAQKQFIKGMVSGAVKG